MSDEKKKEQEAEGEETLVEERRPAWRPQDADREYFRYETKRRISKKELAEFEVYEREEFSEWLSDDEFKALTEKEKRKYVFYRWNDPCGEYWIYRAIADRVWTLKSLFTEACDSEIGGSLYQGIPDSSIRLYVYKS